MTILFSGASPVRRDYGRGLTAQQWARFCGRYLCAESIEKFVRTAVPGGTTLIVDSTSSYFSPLSHVSRKSKGQQQQNLEKMAGNSKGGSSKQRSRSASGMKHTSWLTRTFKKAFHYNENAQAAMAAASEAASSKDSRTGYGEQTGGGRSASLKSSKSTGSSRGNQNRMVIPQVQVTASLTGNGNGGSTTDGESQPGSPVKSSQYNDTSSTSCDNNTRQSSQSSGRKKKHKVKWP